MFIGTDFWYQYYFNHCWHHSHFISGMDEPADPVDHWRRPGYSVLRLNADLIRRKGCPDPGTQRLVHNMNSGDRNYA